jgi:hypothetical protein
MFTGIQAVDSVWVTMSLICGDEFPEGIASRARRLRERLVQAWKDQEVFPEIQAKVANFQDRMRQLIWYRQEEWP